MRKKVLAQFTLDHHKITLNVSYLDSDERSLYNSSEDITNLYKETNVNRYADIVNRLLREANKELSTMIQEVSVVYPEVKLKVSHDKVKLTSEQIKSKGIVGSVEEILSKRNNNDFRKLVKFDKYSIKSSTDEMYDVMGNSYYQDADSLRIIGDIFEVAGINVISYIPKTLLMSHINALDKDFININISLNEIKLNIFRKNMLWEQVLIPNSVGQLIDRLVSIYKVPKAQISSNVLQYVDMEEYLNDTIIFAAEMDDFGNQTRPELTVLNLKSYIEQHINETLERVVISLNNHNVNTMPKIVTGQLLQIKGMKNYITGSFNAHNLAVLDKYHERKAKEIFRKSGETYLRVNNKLLDADTNMVATLKDRANMTTSNHKKIVSFKSIINIVNRKVFDLSKY